MFVFVVGNMVVFKLVEIILLMVLIFVEIL